MKGVSKVDIKVKTLISDEKRKPGDVFSLYLRHTIANLIYSSGKISESKIIQQCLSSAFALALN